MKTKRFQAGVKPAPPRPYYLVLHRKGERDVALASFAVLLAALVIRRRVVDVQHPWHVVTPHVAFIPNALVVRAGDVGNVVQLVDAAP